MDVSNASITSGLAHVSESVALTLGLNGFRKAEESLLLIRNPAKIGFRRVGITMERAMIHTVIVHEELQVLAAVGRMWGQRGGGIPSGTARDRSTYREVSTLEPNADDGFAQFNADLFDTGVCKRIKRSK
ncbi:hypothetical protein BV898_05180 [Hypsibius exemplaris]|uniref:Uncharacterized protein n=1 Tax=Hypsibius exemplaris TaxID=2072580 RepID=A0A1W0X040_HYPEX|nr:hypothetical protein BV898_05180 [Hypsibius exemplaris]